MRGYPVDGTSPKRQSYMDLRSGKSEVSRTPKDFEDRSHILTAVGEAQQAVEDARWAVVGMDWVTSATAVRDALVSLSRAYSLLGSLGIEMPGPKPSNDDFPRELTG